MSTCREVILGVLLVASVFALSFAVTGCGPGIDQRIHVWMDETRKQTKPEDVRAALARFFSYEGDPRFQLENKVVITNELPELVRSLPIFALSPTNIDVFCSKDRNSLELTIGSGFGHWGIIVHRPGYSPDMSAYPACIPWGTGVFFYDEFK
jgi:hypothetical protein